MKFKIFTLKYGIVGFVLALALLLAGCGSGGGGGDDQGTAADAPEPTRPPTYTLTGMIQAPDNALIDSDVNDPMATYAPNDNFIDAQELPNPAIIGGYVNVAGTGPQGRSRSSGDPSDFFRVSLIADQSINLFIAANPTLADLDIYLYDQSATKIDAAMGTESVKSLVAALDGVYFIEVRAVAGASNYNLTIGQNTSQTLAGTLRLSQEFVPGEVIVRFKDDRSSSKAWRSPAGRARMLGMQTKSGVPGREILLRIEGQAGRLQAFRALGIRQAESIMAGHGSTERRKQLKEDTLRIIKSLRRRSDVRHAHPNYIHRALAIPNDPQYPRQWHYPLINLPQGWDVTTGSSSVIVAVVDTGVLMDHPDLKNRLTSDGYDFISESSRARDGDGIDPNPDDPGDGSPGGSSFHGTHVAGTIAAETDNDDGVTGATWSTRIMPLRVLGFGGGGTEYDILQAVRYAAGLENDSGTLPVKTADIINLSLGTSNFSPTAQEIFDQVRVKGIIVVAAAGNGASSLPIYPAAYDGVVSVSAVDISQEPAWYSNFGATVDVAAPGGDISTDINGDGFPDGVLSTCGSDSTGVVEFGYCFYEGTSMAAPHVVGVVALMKALYPALTPDELDTLLISGSITEDLGLPGSGLIDAFAAVAEAQHLAGGGLLPLTLIVNPVALNFGPQSTATLNIKKAGGNPGDPLLVNSVAPDVNWLIISEANVDSDNLGTYAVMVDRRGLAPGLYAATITIDADDPAVNDIDVPVSMQVVPEIVGGNAGYHYALLIDADTLAVVSQDGVPFSQGGYEYTFSGIPAGNYQIFAGTDSDNDFVLGDPGEAFGAYLTLDQPLSVSVSENQDDLDFNSNFDVSLPAQMAAGVKPARPLLQRLKSWNLAK